MTSKRYTGNIITDTPTDPTGNSGANYGVATGVWSLSEARTFSAAGSWPIPASVPGAPTIGTATAGDASASVAFTPNADDGGLDVTSFTATSSPGSITGSASSSPISVTGLTNGTSYTFTVTATNVVGTSAASGSSNSVTPTAPGLVLFGAGGIGTYSNVIQYRDISTTGNLSDFGDLTSTRRSTGAAGNATTSMWAGGQASSGLYINNIDKVTPTSTGNASDYGDLTEQLNRHAGLANSTRAVWSGGDNYTQGARNIIDYKTISSSGNASDFGDLTLTSWYPGATSSSTRGVIAISFKGTGGAAPSNVIDQITIASTGNATDFGDLSSGGGNVGAGTSSGTRGIFFAINSSPQDQIDYFTLSSTGNTSDFGDLLKSGGYTRGGAGSNNTRAIYGVNHDGSNYSSNIQYITIASTGNATDFGDFNTLVDQTSACSTNHGGLQ